MARYVEAIRHAEGGRYEPALALLPADGSLLHARSPDKAVYRAAVKALAGDPTSVRDQARSLVYDIDRFSDPLWHAEFLLVVGISFIVPIAGQTPSSTSKSPNGHPWHFFGYALARRFGRQARAHLDEAEAKELIDHARSLTVDQLLHRNLG